MSQEQLDQKIYVYVAFACLILRISFCKQVSKMEIVPPNYYLPHGPYHFLVSSASKQRMRKTCSDELLVLGFFGWIFRPRRTKQRRTADRSTLDWGLSSGNTHLSLRLPADSLFYRFLQQPAVCREDWRASRKLHLLQPSPPFLAFWFSLLFSLLGFLFLRVFPSFPRTLSLSVSNGKIWSPQPPIVPKGI